ncbi:MAG: Hsp33 family molecular chaperone HslO [Nibricoccus sp.]
MPESNPVNPAESGLEIRRYFVRNRNALIARGSFSELFVDYYLHLSDQQIKVEPEHDALFKRALAGFVLYAASRPWNEMIAWTLHLQEPSLNIFITGDNGTGAVTGRVFTENVREMGANLFYSDVVRGREPKRRSAIDFAGTDPLVAAETFFARSEQRPARYFQIGEEDFALVSEHPDCDAMWFTELNAEKVTKLDEAETLALMERRVYRWHCGCNQQRMMEVLGPTMKQSPDELFGSDEKIEIRCPRCGARHTITREAMEAFVAGTKD